MLDQMPELTRLMPTLGETRRSAYTGVAGQAEKNWTHESTHGRQPGATGDKSPPYGSPRSETSEDFGQPDLARSYSFPWVLAVSTLPVTLAILVIIYLATATEAIPLVVQVSALAATGVTGNVVWALTHRRLQRRAARATDSWRNREAELTEIANREDLTRLYNRRYFYSRLKECLNLATVRKQSLSILMMDVDDLKGINDEFGHQVGDIVLRNFADILDRSADENGLVARLGGDEFAVIMPGADRRKADSVAWALWDELAANPIYETQHASIYLGVSIGISGYPWGGTNIEAMIHWADVNLYANKLARKGFRHPDDQKESQRLASAVVEVLSAALEARDKMTHRHARRVARMSATVAREMQLSEKEVLTIEYAAALHDIGKIGVPDEILSKPVALDSAEWESMRSHSKLGYEILKGVDFLREASEIIFAHHERFDGNGYPKGLRGEEIPLGARVFAVVDSYDAMTSRRVYRDAIPRPSALLEVARHAGTQFDPDVVAAFRSVMRRTLDGPDNVPFTAGLSYGQRVAGG